MNNYPNDEDSNPNNRVETTSFKKIDVSGACIHVQGLDELCPQQPNVVGVVDSGFGPSKLIVGDALEEIACQGDHHLGPELKTVMDHHIVVAKEQQEQTEVVDLSPFAGLEHRDSGDSSTDS